MIIHNHTVRTYTYTHNERQPLPRKPLQACWRIYKNSTIKRLIGWRKRGANRLWILCKYALPSTGIACLRLLFVLQVSYKKDTIMSGEVLIADYLEWIPFLETMCRSGKYVLFRRLFSSWASISENRHRFTWLLAIWSGCRMAHPAGQFKTLPEDGNWYSDFVSPRQNITKWQVCQQTRSDSILWR